MAKMKFRLWFHKLNIKRFHRRRRSWPSPPLPPPPPPPPHCASSPHHSSPAACTISHHQHQLPAPPNGAPLSPVNRKAMDIAYPASASPDRLFRSPNLPAAARILSPIGPAQPVMFRSPMHPLNHIISANSSARGRSIMSSKDDSMGLLVDCGCGPNLASSFRKTKETLQACGGGGGSSRSKSKRRDGAIARSGLQEESWETAQTWNVVAKTGRHSHELFQKKVVLRRRKEKMDAPPTDPLLNKHELGLETPLNVANRPIEGIRKLIKSGLEDVNRDQGDMKLASSFRLSTSSRDATVLDSHWDKEFSSFTSEDPFFSSFERGRPSFSSNSSSEYFERKLNYANLASNYSKLAPNHANLTSNRANLACNGALIKPSKSSIKGSGAVKDSAKRDGLNLAEKGVQSHHDLRCLKPANPLAESFHGIDVGDAGVYSNENYFGSDTRALISTNYSKRSLNSLVGIKEDCEESNMGAMRGNSSRSNSARATDVQRGINYEVNCMSSPNSDYYQRVRADPQRGERTRRIKSSRRGLGGSNALIRRRAQLQARWNLSEEQVQWQSSDNDDESCSSASIISTNHMNDQDRLITRRRRSRDQRTKQSETYKAARASPIMLDNCAERAKSSIISTNNDKYSTNQSKYGTNTRLTESVAVVKCSKDPLVDFRDSMVDMILEKQIYSAEELEELLQCFLSLNSHEHHDTIVQAFTQVWENVFNN